MTLLCASSLSFAGVFEGCKASKNIPVCIKKTAAQGVASAQYTLGMMYYHGRGVAKNYIAAVSWYKKAAAQGQAQAQAKLGAMYYEGRGVKKNYIAAYAWMSLASAKGYKSADALLNYIEKKMTAEQIAKAQNLATKL